MEIVVKNQYDIEEYAMQKHDKKTVIISIASKCMPSAMILPCVINGIKDVLFINFNDTDCNDTVSGCITCEEAIKIKEFVNKYKEDTSIDMIIVQCEAGRSRSAGVAAAIMKYLWNDDSEVFNNSKYNPNMLCYRTVLDKLMEGN